MHKKILKLKSKTGVYDLYITNIVKGKQSSKVRLDQPAKSGLEGFAILSRKTMVPNYYTQETKEQHHITKEPVLFDNAGMCLRVNDDFEIAEHIVLDHIAIRDLLKPGVIKNRLLKRVFKFLRQDGVEIIKASCIPAPLCTDDELVFYNGNKFSFIEQPAKATALHRVGNVLITSKFLQNDTPFTQAHKRDKAKKLIYVDERQLQLFG